MGKHLQVSASKAAFLNPNSTIAPVPHTHTQKTLPPLTISFTMDTPNHRQIPIATPEVSKTTRGGDSASVKKHCLEFRKFSNWILLESGEVGKKIIKTWMPHLTLENRDLFGSSAFSIPARRSRRLDFIYTLGAELKTMCLTLMCKLSAEMKTKHINSR